MASVKEVIQGVVSIKDSADELATMAGGAGADLAQAAAAISGMLEGNSGSGPVAVSAVHTASGSLKKAASSMQELSRAAEKCAQGLAAS